MRCALAAETTIALPGSVCSADDHAPIAYAYLALTDPSFAIQSQTSTATDGSFTLALKSPVKTGYLIVQPPATEEKHGIGVYRHAPRIYTYHGESQLQLALARAYCIVLMAYDRQGVLMRWEDFRKRGTIGDQFMYATDLDDCAVEAACWPVFDEEARRLGQPREKGLPALVVPVDKAYVPQILFWETRDYGKLHLRADNGGLGFNAKAEEGSIVLNLNAELARTAVNDLERRGFGDKSGQLKSALSRALAKPTGPERAASCDIVLAEALRFRDTLELERARQEITRYEKPRSDFTFGVFEGSPYNERAFQIARDAGFDLATVLLGWGWTDAADRQGIEQTFGIEKLRKQGYQLKAHGVVWLQDYGILPPRVRSMNAQQLRDAELAQARALLDNFGGAFSLWEAMNEPNVTNTVGMPREWVLDLLLNSAQLANAHGNLQALVNSAHEGDYGRRFAVYTPDNRPANDWNRTYLSYLKDVFARDGAAHLDVIGLQYYPGFHFNKTFAGLEGPATTPSWLVDAIDRYAALGRPIHITEFSLPSSYQPDWTSGYWREPWTEQTQADYAEMVFTLAYANPRVHSITWWDITDAQSSVITGGMCEAGGRPKPVLDRLRKLIATWKTP